MVYYYLSEKWNRVGISLVAAAPTQREGGSGQLRIRGYVSLECACYITFMNMIRKFNYN